MAHLRPVLRGQSFGDERSMTCLGISLYTEQRRGAAGRQLRDDRLERRAVEDLARVAHAVLRGELDARALADAASRVLGILEMPELGGRREVLVVAIFHGGGGQCGLEAGGVRPGI